MFANGKYEFNDPSMIWLSFLTVWRVNELPYRRHVVIVSFLDGSLGRASFISRLLATIPMTG